MHELAQRPDGTLYSAQKLVRGRTLKAALAQCRTLKQRLELLPHLLNAAQAVAYAHGRSVIDRDLKPSNVMVGPYGETVVVDWGLAKRRGEPEPARAKQTPEPGPDLTQEGVALGTPSYMSPEQARGELEAIDERSDVFALGAMLYELLTGRFPFQGADNTQVIEAVLRGRPVPVRTLCPEAPPELAAIAERALRSIRAERYPDAGAFAGELLAYVAGGRVEAYTYGPLELARKFVRRNPALSVAIAASALILLASGLAVVVQLRQARVNLASALVQRARRAEDVSDWARAAAYYAASRVENDTMVARWGIALARERLPERGTTRTGPPGAFTDVDVLPEGTVVALETRDRAARLYEVATGRTLWTVETVDRIHDARITSGAVRLSSGRLIRILDERTGQERFTSDPDRETLCRNGPPTRRGSIDRPGVLRVAGAEGPLIAAEIGDPCAVSEPGDRLAFRDLQGVVRLRDLDEGREITSRAAPDTQEIVFTAHGVALVRGASLQLFGGPEGDYSLEVPGRSVYGFAYAPGRRGVTVSADGHRVVVDNPTLNRADVVDLRDRVVFVSLTRPPGEPSYAFSPDGSKLYAAGLSGGRALIAWNLRRPVASAGGPVEGHLHLEVARGRFIFFENRRRVEVRSDDGKALRTIVDGEVLDVALSADGSTLAIAHPEDIAVQRVEDGQELAGIPCETCVVVLLSADGSRLAGLSRERRRVWDVRGGAVVLDEPMGAAELSVPFVLSPAGDRLGCDRARWVRAAGSLERRAQPPSPAGESRWGQHQPGRHPGGRLPPGQIRTLEAARAGAGLDRPQSFVRPGDGGLVRGRVDRHRGLPGRRRAPARRRHRERRWPGIVAGRAGSRGLAGERAAQPPGRVSRGPRFWALLPLPGPDTTLPAESLRRALAEGGFRLRGVEIERSRRDRAEPAPMDDRNFILGVLAAQAGFVTPAQVIAAGSARMLARDGRSVLDHLVDSGALTPERRDIIVTLANEALAASGGTPERVLESLPGARALARTLGSELAADAAAASPSPGDGDLVPVEREGQYARLDELGRGGQSIVWRALDRFVGREVALKELTWPGAEKSSGSTRAAQARFLREARLTAQLDHPGIATVLELARRPDGTLYSAQKLVRGRTLKAALAQCRTLSQRLELLPHLVNAAQTMAYAHTRAVVHRDLKPSNVMVGPYGETVVVDWGLAKRRGEAEPASDTPTPDLGPELTQAGVALGTPSYMSPEQARGDLQAIDERSDVFSLGAMLYELLTGRPPFQGLDNAQVIEAVRSGHIVPVRVVCPEAPAELAAIAERALRRNPAERYPDAAAFASELLAYRAGARVEAYSYGSLELARKFVQRNPALSVAIAASVLILIGAAVAMALQLRQARVNLASALIERARRAEDVSDWARAAAYYAASRLQNDTTAARWGLALARERMPERGSALTGGPGAFTDVDVLPDGTALALETRENLARLYDAATGRSLWTAQMAEPIQRARITSGAVRLLSGHVEHILDEHTGAGALHLGRRRENRFAGTVPPRAAVASSVPASFTSRGRRARASRSTLVMRAPFPGTALDWPSGICQGLVHLWDLDARREITSRPAPDAQDIVFTAHGVALVRSGSLQLFGGPEGDFSVEVPGRSASGFAFVAAGRGLAVSPDGHRVVVDSPSLNRADVVDLRDRAVFVSVSRPPGDPSYAFSPDGSKLYAAGLSGGRALISWNLRRPDATTSGSAGSRVYLRTARDRFMLDDMHRMELRADDGTLLRTIDVPGTHWDARIASDGSTIAIAYPEEIVVHRADDGRELARLSCKLCLVVMLSENGSRVVGFSRERRRVWDVDGPKLVRDEPLGGVSLTAPKTLSPSGDRMAWCENDGVVVEDLSTGSLTRLALPETPRSTSISPDGTRMVVSLPASFAVWKLPGLERVWAVPNPSSVPAAVGWSADGSHRHRRLRGGRRAPAGRAHRRSPGSHRRGSRGSRSFPGQRAAQPALPPRPDRAFVVAVPAPRAGTHCCAREPPSHARGGRVPAQGRGTRGRLALMDDLEQLQVAILGARSGRRYSMSFARSLSRRCSCPPSTYTVPPVIRRANGVARYAQAKPTSMMSTSSPRGPSAPPRSAALEILQSRGRPRLQGPRGDGVDPDARRPELVGQVATRRLERRLHRAHHVVVGAPPGSRRSSSWRTSSRPRSSAARPASPSGRTSGRRRPSPWRIPRPSSRAARPGGPPSARRRWSGRGCPACPSASGEVEQTASSWPGTLRRRAVR